MGDHFAVAGAGLAGLTAAVALAERGHRVTVFEQAHKIGGRATTELRNGFHLNLGAHALYRNGPAYRTLRAWDVPFSGKSPAVKSRAFVVDAGKRHAFPAGPLQLFTTTAFRGLEKLAAAHAFQTISTKPAAVPANLTLAGFFDAKLKPGPARRFAEALVRLSTYSNQHEILSARAALAQVQFAIKHNVLYLDGGWDTLVQGLAAKAAGLGVEIRTGVAFEHGRYSGVILAIPPAAIEAVMGVKLPALAPIRAACLDIALRAAPENAAVFGLGLDQPLYYSMHSAVAALAPPGGALIHVMKYLRDDAVCEREELEAFAGLLAPGWEALVDFARFLPNMTVSHAVPTPAGRPEVDAISAAFGIPGVAIAGDWVGDEGMLADTAVASALRAAEMVAERRALAA